MSRSWDRDIWCEHAWLDRRRLLGGELDDQLWTLNAIVGRTVLPWLMGGRTAPGEIGIVHAGFDLGQAGCGVGVVDDAGPFHDQIKEHCPLLIIHFRPFQSFGHDRLPFVARAQHQIVHAVIQDGLFSLVSIQSVQQGEGLVILPASARTVLPFEV